MVAGNNAIDYWLNDGHPLRRLENFGIKLLTSKNYTPKLKLPIPTAYRNARAYLLFIAIILWVYYGPIIC